MNSKTIVNKILDIPGFREYIYSDDGCVSALYDESEFPDIPYTIAQDFARFMLVEINKAEARAESSKIVERSFGFIEEMLDSPQVHDTPELLNIIYLGVLAMLVDNPKINVIAEKHMNESALKLFQKYTGKIIGNEPFYQ